MQRDSNQGDWKSSELIKHCRAMIFSFKITIDFAAEPNSRSEEQRADDDIHHERCFSEQRNQRNGGEGSHRARSIRKKSCAKTTGDKMPWVLPDTFRRLF